jgi:ADP-ribose pyrophosphatase YjhB (NUDIX family)
MKFCSQCGAPVQHKIPEGDNLPRYVCVGCNTIHYQNPKIIAGCIAEWDQRILLCKRSIEPRYGYWTLPAGFLENGETIYEGAAREAEEEANARVTNMSLYCSFSIPHISQVYLMFRGDLEQGRASPGDESLEVALFTEDETPWDQLAFPVIRETLKLYFHDRRKGQFPVHGGDIIHDNKQILIRHHRPWISTST